MLLGARRHNVGVNIENFFMNHGFLTAEKMIENMKKRPVTFPTSWRYGL
jgi:hypothetical protein